MLTPSIMMEAAMSTVIESKEFWQEQLEQFNTSGLSRSEYCRNNSINYDRFSYWLRKSSPASSPAFVPVRVQTLKTSTDQPILCTIELRGHVLKIYDVSAFSILLERLG
jgi:hypothetical protein